MAREYEKKVLPDGRIQIRPTIGYSPEGKQIKKKKTFKKGTYKKDIEAWIAQQKADYSRGHSVDPSNKTVNQLIDEWVKTKDWTEKTLKDNTGTFKRYVRPVIGSKKLQDVKPTHIQQIFTPMSEKGLSERTIKLCYTLVNALFGYAEDVELIARNPAKKLRKHLPKGTPKKDIEILRPAELAEFLSKESDYSTLYKLLVSTGLRIGEALALEWKHVGDSLRIEQSLVNVTNGFKIGPPKNKNAYRNVPMTAELKALLEELPRDKYVFSGKGRNRYKLILEDFKQLLGRNIGIHALRHTACTLMLLNDVPLKVISDLMGHHSVAFTLDTYSHLIPEMWEGVPEKLSGIFFSGTFQAPKE